MVLNFENNSHLKIVPPQPRQVFLGCGAPALIHPMKNSYTKSNLCLILGVNTLATLVQATEDSSTEVFNHVWTTSHENIIEVTQLICQNFVKLHMIFRNMSFFSSNQKLTNQFNFNNWLKNL